MPCLISMIIAILIPYILFPNNGILFWFFFSKIFVETQDEVSIFTLLHTIHNEYFFKIITTVFSQNFCWGTCFRGRFFGPHSGWSHMGGGSSRRGWYQMRGTWKKWPLRPKCLPMYYSTISVSFGVLKYSFLCSFELKRSQNWEKNEVKVLKFSGAKLKGGGLQALIKKWGRRSVGGGNFLPLGDPTPPGKLLIAWRAIFGLCERTWKT